MAVREQGAGGRGGEVNLGAGSHAPAIFTARANLRGFLRSILHEIAVKQVQLSHIHSRSCKRRSFLGSYLLFSQRFALDRGENSCSGIEY